METSNPLVLFPAAALISCAATPLAMAIARRLGFLDLPAANKAHLNPTPLLGGLAIVLAFFVIFSMGECRLTVPMAGILAGGLLMAAVGLVDDRKRLTPWIKLAWQFLAAAVAVSCGIRALPGWEVWISLPVTFVWLVGITNSFNLLDNMDGLCAGVSVICAGVLYAVFMTPGLFADPRSGPTFAFIALALAGSCAGFLSYNFPPARVFMGDCGSLFIGFTLAGLSLMAGRAGGCGLTVAAAVPILILGVPIFDTVLVTVTRALAGLPVSLGGKDHSSHRLRNMGFSPRQVVLIHYSLSVCFGFCGLWLVRGASPMALPILGVALAGSLFLGFFLGRIRVDRPCGAGTPSSHGTGN